MKIRSTKDGDYAEIANLRRQTIRNVNSNDYPKKTILDWTSRANTQTFRDSANKFKRWVAVDNEKIIGFCEHNYKCELTRIYVHKNHLRKSVGSNLMKVAEDSLKKQGCKEIKIESTITAKNFYIKNGYKFTKEISCTEVNNATVFLMSKKLK